MKKSFIYFVPGFVIGLALFFGLPKLEGAGLFLSISGGWFFIRPNFVGGNTVGLYFTGIPNAIVLGVIFALIYKIVIVARRIESRTSSLILPSFFFSLGVYLAYILFVLTVLDVFSNWHPFL